MTKVVPYPPTSPDWQSPTAHSDLPYDYVPVSLCGGSADGERVPADTPDVPIWHDGANSGQSLLYSGELHCTLRTLSPLLVANQQLPIAELTDDARTVLANAPSVSLAAFLEEAKSNYESATAQLNRQLEAERDSNKRRDIQKKISAEEKNYNTLMDKVGKKRILFPLQLDEHEPILIPGESLKGMFRQALGALLSSPLERVQEASFSTRPNTHPAGGLRTKPCAGRVVQYDPDALILVMELIEDLGAIEFVHGKVPQLDDGTILKGGYCSKGRVIIQNKQRIVRRNGRQDTLRWVDGFNETLGPGYCYLRYHYALDEKRFYKRLAGSRGQDHPGAFLPMANLATSPIEVDPAVVRQYLDTFEHLRDAQAGHLKRNNTGRPETDKDQIQWSDLAPNDLIFLEWLAPADGQPGRVISFGHNFRYRWKCLDTVTTVAIDFDGKKWNVRRRPELSAHPDERPAPSSGDVPMPPEKLSSVRGLLGFAIVSSEGHESEVEHPMGRLADLKDPFNRLAGRIAFNIGMERLSGQDNAQSRFVNADRGGFLFLHPAASAKAAFADGHVPGEGRGWGEGLVRLQTADAEVYALQAGTRQFAGRRIFPHQFIYDPVRKQIFLKRYNYDLSALLQEQTMSSLTAMQRWDLVKFLWGDQSAVAARVSRAGRKFGFTVRFKDLRAWELAALAAVLQPELLAEAIRDSGEMSSFPACHAMLLAQKQRFDDGAAYAKHYAHKLGHGKAMGMGSVSITIDSLELWSRPAASEDRQAPSKFFCGLIREHLLKRDGLVDATVRQWLRVLQLVPYRAIRPYLLHQDETGTPQIILDWTRKLHAEHLSVNRAQGFGSGVVLANLETSAATTSPDQSGSASSST